MTTMEEKARAWLDSMNIYGPQREGNVTPSLTTLLTHVAAEARAGAVAECIAVASEPTGMGFALEARMHILARLEALRALVQP
jgi:hypothetical protein